MSKTQARDMIADLISTIECAELPQFPDLLAKAQERPAQDVEDTIVTLLAAGFGLGLYAEGVW